MLESKDRDKVCTRFSRMICETGYENKVKEIREIKKSNWEKDHKWFFALLSGCRETERLRKIIRTYEPAKKDLNRTQLGMKPVKPFVSRKDFVFWKQVIKKTDKCIKSGKNSKEVSIYVVFICFLRFAFGQRMHINGSCMGREIILNSLLWIRNCLWRFIKL